MVKFSLNVFLNGERFTGRRGVRDGISFLTPNKMARIIPRHLPVRQCEQLFTRIALFGTKPRTSTSEIAPFAVTFATPPPYSNAVKRG